MKNTIATLILLAPLIAQAREAAVAPYFNKAQEQVRLLTSRNENLGASVASLFGITEARLEGQGKGRTNYLLAQYMVMLEVNRESQSQEYREFAKSLLKDMEWGYKVISNFRDSAQRENLDLCEPQVVTIDCYYYILSNDMNARLAALPALSGKKK
jgi:hypothetical protein